MLSTVEMMVSLVISSEVSSLAGTMCSFSTYNKKTRSTTVGTGTLCAFWAALTGVPKQLKVLKITNAEVQTPSEVFGDGPKVIWKRLVPLPSGTEIPSTPPE